MKHEDSVFDRLRAQGEKVFSQISNELADNPQFIKAVETAFRGKERLEDAVGQAMRAMNVPSRTDLKKALSRIESLEEELARVKRAAADRAKAEKKAAASARAAAVKKKAPARPASTRTAAGRAASGKTGRTSKAKTTPPRPGKPRAAAAESVPAERGIPPMPPPDDTE